MQVDIQNNDGINGIKKLSHEVYGFELFLGGKKLYETFTSAYPS